MTIDYALLKELRSQHRVNNEQWNEVYELLFSNNLKSAAEIIEQVNLSPKLGHTLCYDLSKSYSSIKDK